MRDGFGLPDHIALRGVSKIYGRGSGAVSAVESVSLGVGRNEFVSILGPSGCGKSTVLMMLAGLIPASAGAIEVDGAPIAGPRRDTGIVFQSPVLLPWLTVLDNVLLPVRMAGGDVESCRAKAIALLEVTGIADFRDRLPRELSGGMRQRVAICRALVNDPILLLMDEPFSALDAITREEMNLELLRVWERDKKTVVFVTHSIAEAVFLSDKVVVMSRRPATIVEEIRVDLKRPRDAALHDAPEFGALCARVRRLISH